MYIYMLTTGLLFILLSKKYIFNVVLIAQEAISF